MLYKDSIDISVDSPYLELSSWNYDKNTLDKYDEVTKETRTIFEQQVKISLEAIKKKDRIENSFLYFTYQTNRQNTPQQRLFSLDFPNIEAEAPSSKNTISKASPPSNHGHERSALSALLHLDMQSCSRALSTLVEQTGSLPIRLMLVFLLGILLSLTPCIYPMIPITVGICKHKKVVHTPIIFYILLLMHLEFPRLLPFSAFWQGLPVPFMANYL